MTGQDYAAQSQALSVRSAAHASSDGPALLEEMDSASKLLVAWTNYCAGASANTSAKVLLDGAQAAAREAAGCVALGLARPALFSLRAQIDMMMAWLFYRDHPVEWRHAERTAGDAKLRADVVKYLNTFIPRFKERFAILLSRRTRRSEEPYGILSAHVHSLTPTTVPRLSGLQSLVATKTLLNECVAIQADVNEYLSDTLVAVYATMWSDLPDVVRAGVRSRLSAPQLKDLTRP
jgi:hypothetical protein